LAVTIRTKEPEVIQVIVESVAVNMIYLQNNSITNPERSKPTGYAFFAAQFDKLNSYKLVIKSAVLSLRAIIGYAATRSIRTRMTAESDTTISAPGFMFTPHRIQFLGFLRACIVL